MEFKTKKELEQLTELELEHYLDTIANHQTKARAIYQKKKINRIIKKHKD